MGNMIYGELIKEESKKPVYKIIQKIGNIDLRSGKNRSEKFFPIEWDELVHGSFSKEPDFDSSEEEDNSLCVVWQGKIYNRSELIQSLEPDSISARELGDDELFLKLYRLLGRECVKKINGRFVFALYDPMKQEVVLGRDHLGIETLYYYEDQNRFVYGSRIPLLLEHPEVPKELDMVSLGRFLVFNFNLSWDTFYKNIKKVKPGSLLILNRNGAFEEKYWHLSFQPSYKKDINEYVQELRELMEDAVRIRTQNNDSLGIFLSGGMDSSSIAYYLKEVTDRSLNSYSYRTLSESFDESNYARVMANFCDSDHHEVIYRPEDVQLIAALVNLMDEPYCNIGINIATFLLGQEAQNKSNIIFTGHGGDELFGGHPVYSADKVGAYFDRIPGALRAPLTAGFRQIPDSTQKLSLSVKLKRFSESVNYPKELGTYRWRVYYNSDELRELFHADMDLNALGNDTIFRDVINLTREAEGVDSLSRSLYVDTKTEVSFHLRRINLINSLGIDSSFPLLDHRLVEYAATIPSNLKLRGYSDTKYIQRVAMSGLLPDEISNRKDKLGHSIPFKNWLRTDPIVKQFVGDILAEESIRRRGLFESNYVHTLWEDHQIHRQNNSHRLWALAVLELWLSANNLSF
jgi:asparagine synthase (glutamine-hydrolysing)